VTFERFMNEKQAKKLCKETKLFSKEVILRQKTQFLKKCFFNFGDYDCD
jgi:hypothetical protein